ncbi:RNA-directed DNA polymerase, eukaryota, reverse transcriptase zinc-binding domain protein [Tanacetum coccineum]
MKKSANRYSILDTLPEDDDMIKYFKEKWKENDDIIEEDVIEEVCELEKNIESIDRNVKFYCTFVYASNNKEERKILWKELYMHKRVSNNHPWALLGDLNVTLNVDEHSSGGSFINEEMQEFKDYINLIKIEDIRSTGFFYTWTKSLKNPDNSVLKKLDRVMVSESFHEDFARSQAIFLPFMISDHSPATLVIPSCGKKKANLVKKIKALKPILNKMNWKNGDLTVKVGNLRELLKESQATVEKNPHDQNLRKKSIEIMEEYCIAVKDEEKLLAQKARID